MQGHKQRCCRVEAPVPWRSDSNKHRSPPERLLESGERGRKCHFRVISALTFNWLLDTVLYLVSGEGIKFCYAVTQGTITINNPHLRIKTRPLSYTAPPRKQEITAQALAFTPSGVCPTSESGRQSFAPRANPPPTPSVPKAPVE